MIKLDAEKLVEARKIKNPTDRQVQFANDLINQVNAWLSECRTVCAESSPVVDSVETYLESLINVFPVFTTIDHLKSHTKSSIAGLCAAHARRLRIDSAYYAFNKAANA